MNKQSLITMAKLTRQQIEEEMNENINDGIYFSNINFIVSHYSPADLKAILRDEPKSDQLNEILVKMKSDLEQVQAFELCIVIRDYLKETSK